MAAAEITVSASLLAEWLAKRAPKIWWFLDGEREVSVAQPLPAQGEDLAAAFERHGGTLAVVQEDPAHQPSGDVVDVDALDKLFEPDGGERALELAWIDGGHSGEPWLLVESVVNEDAKDLPSEAWQT
jgi:hypothetical protein